MAYISGEEAVQKIVDAAKTVCGPIENEAAASVVRVPADAMQIEPVTVAPLVAVPVLILLFIGLLFMTRRRKSVRTQSRKGKKQETIEGGIQNEDT